jgi:hypothetical protein
VKDDVRKRMTSGRELTGMMMIMKKTANQANSGASRSGNGWIEPLILPFRTIPVYSIEDEGITSIS